MFKLNSFLQHLNEAGLRTPPIQKELRDKYEKEINKLQLIDSGPGIEINLIRINNSFQGKGVASEIIQRILDYSDDFNKILHLTPTDEYGSDVKRLTAFYKGFGFVMNRGKNRDKRFKDTMIRYPDTNESVKNTFRYKGANPTVDLVVIREDKVLLIRRAKSSPAEGGKWALPGGFHDTNAKRGEEWKAGKETAESAALRELKEETGLSIGELKKTMKFIGTYEGGNRDPRDNSESWTKSNAFTVNIDSNMGDDVKGQDDADKAEWVDIKKAQKMGLAFDHNKILKDAINRL